MSQLTATAEARPSQKKAIWGPALVAGKSQFPIYSDLGVGIWQRAVSWRNVSPTRPVNPTDPNDPAYRWDDTELDFGVREAARYGIRVSLTVLQTPSWANGGQPGTHPPHDSQSYAKFMEALSRRYPSVHLYMVWGEPIRVPNFNVHPTRAPNYYARRDERTGARLPVFNALQRADARKYAELVDSTYGRLKARSKANMIIGGNTTTSGEVDPFNWVRHMRLSDGRPPRMDLFGHNPFGTRAPNLAKDQILVGTADFSDLDIFVPWIDRWLSRSGRNKRLRLFISEYTAPTDVPSFEFPYHVTREVQARWLAAGLRIARSWKRIYTLGWIGLRDPPPRTEDGQEARNGLIDARGVRKAAYFAYRRG